MTGIIFSLFAAGSAATSNLFFHKNLTLKEQADVKGYLVFFYLISLLSTFFFMIKDLNESLHYGMVGIGAVVGILNIALMRFTFSALENGSAGLTFAFQSASAVFPGMILFLLFGEENGFTYSYQKLVGILIIIAGLFWGAKKASTPSGSGSLFQWLKYIFGAVAVQVLALSLIQARCVLMDCSPTEAFSSSASLASRDDISFMLGQFGAAFLVQGLYFLSLRQLPKKGAAFGALGGIANFTSSLMLLLSTKWAEPYEQALLFPCFSIATMITCNLWAKWLYGEKFYIVTNGTCAAGIIIGLLE